MSDLATRLDVLVPPELTRGDWGDVTRRVRPRRRLLTLKVALAFALFLVLVAAAAATYLIARGHRIDTPAPGALTMSAGGHSIFHPPNIVELRPGGGLRVVWRCPAKDCGGYLTSVAWAPDGVHVAFTLDAFNFGAAYLGLHILDTRTGRDRHVGGYQGARLGCGQRRWTSYTDVTWSPDSRTLAFTCAHRVHVVSADLRHPRLVPTGFTRSEAATWSPDEARIGFESGGSIYVMRLDGSSRRRIVASGEAPDWSPGGSRIAYEGRHGVRIVSPAGVDVTPHGRNLEPRGAPRWSPDGTRLAIGAGNGVYVVSLASGRAIRVARPATGAYGPAWYPDRHARRSPANATCGEC